MQRSASVLLIGVSACASGSVARRADALEQIVASASQRGALQCAPEELALARVHLEFARLELSQGDPHKAERHLTLAEPNAKAALRVASDARCKTSASRPLGDARGSAHEPERTAGANDAAP
jgi:hypothetical protein